MLLSVTIKSHFYIADVHALTMVPVILHKLTEQNVMVIFTDSTVQCKISNQGAICSPAWNGQMFQRVDIRKVWCEIL